MGADNTFGETHFNPDPPAKKVQWSRYGPLGNISQSPLPPAEGAEAIVKKYEDEYDFKFHWVQRDRVIRMMREFAAQQHPTAEGAENLDKQIKQLKEFHTAFNLPQRQVPTIMPSPEFFLRHKILMEEVEELREAYNEGDIVEVADAITDCLYVLFGTALQFGIADKLEACFDEVHRSNMSKLGNDGKPIMREDGKVMKGENFKRPDLERVLNEPVAAQQQPTAEGAEEIAQRCPVCGGNGLVNNGFYTQTSGHWSSNSTVPETCRSCNGTGVVFATLHAQRIADKMVAENLVEFGNMIRDEPNGDIAALAEYFIRTINLKARER